MIWWISNPDRALAEQAAIAELQERADWLSGLTWTFETGSRLAAEFTIRHLEETFDLKIVYPTFFPSTPPQVLPRENILLSNHQWGTGGELCLEIRPDNWYPDYVGAMLIESAHRLLSGERPAEGEMAEVPSAHNMSQAQTLRGDTGRFLLDVRERAALAGLAEAEVVEIALAEHRYNGHWLAQLTRIGPETEPRWIETARVLDASKYTGFAVRVPASAEWPLSFSNESLRTLLAAIGAGAVIEGLDKNFGRTFVLLVRGQVHRMVLPISGSEKPLVLPYSTVDIPQLRPRLSGEYAGLPQKSVAIAGGGSIGSKLAVSLARAGVGKFLLVDEDILFPENLVRNDLDSQAVGMHKVDGIAARILEVNPQADIQMRRMKLGGQESSASTDTALRAMGQCDLIMDATAEPQVFNLLAAVALADRKPMLWGEVFAGGIGGFIARARPDIDPPPHAARRQIAAWCDAQDAPWEGKPTRDYGVEQGDAPPLVADDADVTVIAAHITRFALDTLMRGAEASAFASPVYMIGLARDWIFSGPFDTVPINFRPEGAWKIDDVENRDEKLKALAEALFSDEKPSPDEAASEIDAA